MIEEYFRLFKEKPFLNIPFTYDMEPYPTLIKKAIDRGSPITNKEIDDAFKDIKYDAVPDFDADMDDEDDE